jgi:TetR/AcrR family transcriptional repressor of nem operon
MPKKLQTRERLLDRGLELLLTQGFSATGVAEVTAAAGVPKGSFYNYFPSKDDFALAVLDRYQVEACREMSSVLRGQGSPLERLRKWVAASRERMADRRFQVGCLAGRLAQELAGEQPAFRAPLEEAFLCMQSHLELLLREAREKGEIPSDLDIEAVAEFILNAWQGAAQRAKAAHTAQPLENFERLLFERILRSSD